MTTTFTPKAFILSIEVEVAAGLAAGPLSVLEVVKHALLALPDDTIDFTWDPFWDGDPDEVVTTSEDGITVRLTPKH